MKLISKTNLSLKMLRLFFVLFLIVPPILSAYWYYDDLNQIRDPLLNYSWRQSKDVELQYGAPGKTVNRTYFEITQYGKLCELTYCGMLYPYGFIFKHEEGHIRQHQLLNTADYDLYRNQSIFRKFNLSRQECQDLKLSDCLDYSNYLVFVAEGDADHYALANLDLPGYSLVYRFGTFILGKIERVQALLSLRAGNTEGYRFGRQFFEWTLAQATYLSSDEYVKAIGSEEQYLLWQKFSNL